MQAERGDTASSSCVTSEPRCQMVNLSQFLSSFSACFCGKNMTIFGSLTTQLSHSIKFLLQSPNFSLGRKELAMGI